MEFTVEKKRIPTLITHKSCRGSTSNTCTTINQRAAGRLFSLSLSGCVYASEKKDYTERYWGGWRKKIKEFFVFFPLLLNLFSALDGGWALGKSAVANVGPMTRATFVLLRAVQMLDVGCCYVIFFPSWIKSESSFTPPPPPQPPGNTCVQSNTGMFSHTRNSSARHRWVVCLFAPLASRAT